ncbi:hypothetical protein ACLB2K_071909 [Fragaria x ananassa]
MQIDDEDDEGNEDEDEGDASDGVGFEDEGNEDEDEDEDEDEGDEDEDDDINDDYIAGLDDVPPFSKTVRKSTSASQLYRRNRSCGGTKAQSNIKHAADGLSSTRRSFLQERPEIIELRKSTALQRTNEYNDSLDYVCIPPDFSHRHLNEKPCAANIWLNGEIWKSRFSYKRSDDTRWYGWKAIAEANNLEKGDACLFVLINNVNYTFEVSIFRTTEKVQIDPPH